jgi:hypothetical protein
MRRISAYFISLLVIALANPVIAQDSLKVPLSIRTGFDVFGPVYYSFKPDNLTLEGYVAYDYDSKKSFIIESGYQNFKFSQYNYNYLSKGVFLKFGMDFNLIKPFQAEGKYYGGIGVRYGISFYNSGVPSFKHDNYWGTGTGTISSGNHIAHFVEVNPGLRTQIFKYVSIGWTIRLRLLISGGTAINQKAVSIPGFGNGTKIFSPGINYYISINIPYKTVYVKPEIEKVPETESPTEKKGN